MICWHPDFVVPLVAYHGGSSSVVVAGSNGAVGQRRPYHGILLLHSALQLPTRSLEEEVTIDLLYSEVSSSLCSIRQVL